MVAWSETVSWIVFVVMALAVLAAARFALKRIEGYHDPWHTPQHQAEAFLWTQHQGDGGNS
ncbi:MAG TPA: hypothetical protein VNN79_14055 [Actinomycetota bacterium]|nr:hypothetical protein [Actinomycetota bacterium]